MLIPINTAKRIAQFSNIKRARVSAIAFTSNGHIIAVAHNRRIGGNPDKWTQHAEAFLIQKLIRIKAWDRFKNITILILRIGAHGVNMAKPCNKCQTLLKKYPVKILYTDSAGVIQLFK